MVLPGMVWIADLALLCLNLNVNALLVWMVDERCSAFQYC